MHGNQLHPQTLKTICDQLTNFALMTMPLPNSQPSKIIMSSFPDSYRHKVTEYIDIINLMEENLFMTFFYI